MEEGIEVTFNPTLKTLTYLSNTTLERTLKEIRLSLLGYYDLIEIPKKDYMNYIKGQTLITIPNTSEYSSTNMSIFNALESCFVKTQRRIIYDIETMLKNLPSNVGSIYLNAQVKIIRHILPYSTSMTITFKIGYI